MGLQHAGILSALLQKQVALCDVNKRLVRVARRAVPNMKIYDDFSEMWEAECLDTIFICTPPHSHIAAVERALALHNGANIFVEKPLGVNHLEANNIVNRVKTSTGTRMVGFQKRFKPTFAKTKEYLTSGALGDLTNYNAHVYSADVLRKASGWKFERTTGGVSLDFGPHLIDLLLWYVGQASTFKSQKKSIYSNEVEDYIICKTRYDSGIEGQIELCWSMEDYIPDEFLIHLEGEKGTITVSDDYMVVNLKDEIPHSGLISGTFYARDFPQYTPYLLAYPEYTIEDSYFINCALSNLKCNPGFEDGAQVNKFIDEMLAAS